jgi:Reverse transcriptase (RNA-dependent DNA polymerase).
LAPSDFQEATTCCEVTKWKEAMVSLVINQTWTLVNKPPKDKKLLELKWVYKRKSESVYKGRLVARGYQQIDYIDDTYSAVAKMPTPKLLLSYCCQNSLAIHLMDVETALLNGRVLSM